MEMESGGEDATFQEQPITDDGPGQESAVGCVTDGKRVLQSGKTQHRTLQNPLLFSKLCGTS